ncbi:Uma2 family endonuclease [Anaerolineales bacterium HSG6]|nr:Uma2 family endonuclease [Anaerolineales bacterium HSG6]MDM8529867.1 Uma2 family endonuclease [Anaerolineales bacterium HSG25]
MTTQTAQLLADSEQILEQIDDEFYYGYRTLISYDDEGKKLYSYQPLSLDDFLDPQEGDLFMQGTLHNDDVEALKGMFRYLHRDNELTVYSDLKILWALKWLKQPAPDVMVIPDVVEPDKPRSSFDVALEKTRPIFVLEVVSPRYRQPDRTSKVAIYEQAQVAEYIIIDSWLKENGAVQYEILGYRLQGAIYTEVKPDKQGRIFSQINQVWLSVNEAKTQFIVTDQNGELLLSDQEARQLVEAELQAEVEAHQQTEAELRATQARLADVEALLRQAQNTS